MSSVIFPNFGAEEGSGWRRHLARPAIRALASGYVRLFGVGARVLEHDALGLPAILAHGHQDPAWSFLDDTQTPRLCSWLVTDEAERLSTDLGLEPTGPTAAVQRHVHDKAFSYQVATDAGWDEVELSSAIEVLPVDPGELERARPAIVERVAAWPEAFGGAWALKPRWGTSGRGRRSGRGPEALDTLLRGGAARALAKRSGAVLEPWLDRIQDFSVQLWVPEQGDVEVLGTTRQLLSPSGVYQGNEGIIDALGRPSANTEVDADLERAALAVGVEAQAAGFSGVCGTDAFTYRGEDGRSCLRPLVELNARATGGVVVAGQLRRQWVDGAASAGDTFIYDATEDRLVLRRPA